VVCGRRDFGITEVLVSQPSFPAVRILCRVPSTRDSDSLRAHEDRCWVCCSLR
jgi:hypothetical protein